MTPYLQLRPICSSAVFAFSVLALFIPASTLAADPSSTLPALSGPFTLVYSVGYHGTAAGIDSTKRALVNQMSAEVSNGTVAKEQGAKMLSQVLGELAAAEAAPSVRQTVTISYDGDRTLYQIDGKYKSVLIFDGARSLSYSQQFNRVDRARFRTVSLAGLLLSWSGITWSAATKKRIGRQ